MKIAIIFLITLLVLLSGCALTSDDNISSDKSKVSTSECGGYNDENIHKIKLNFEDIETNKKIDKCLQTSEDIKFYDITNDDFIQKNPSVFGDYVVWEDYKNKKSDIYLYNILTEEIRRITTNEGEDFKPIIRNNLIKNFKFNKRQIID